MKKVKIVSFSRLSFSVLITSVFLFLPACNGNKIHLAADAKTGEYLGVVMTETRDLESKVVLSYTIGIDGRKFEKLPQEITIYEP